ncbi:uncharacterized protein [Ptychodera flava]|uniref:uncharacterized protein n=1 Tax=Ptychodera flava TaxID=63121 RepID=UPI00396A7600
MALVDVSNLTGQDRSSSQPFRDNFLLWLCKHFHESPGKVVVIDDIISATSNRICAAQKGAIVRQLFPSVRRSRMYINGKRCHVYVNLDRGPGDKLLKYPDQFVWSDLLKLDTRGSGWIPRGRQNSNNSDSSGKPLDESQLSPCFEWLLFEHGKLCNQQKVIRELRIYEDFTWTLRISGRKATQCFGLPTVLSGASDEIYTLFLVAAAAKLCPGFDVLTRRDTRSLKGEVIGRAEDWVQHEDETVSTSLVHRSVACQMILSTENPETVCKRCATVKKNCGRDMFSVTTSETSKYKRESYMTEQELTNKLVLERKQKIKAKKREQRLRAKLNDEMIIFSRENHEDLESIFKSTDGKTTCGDNQDLVLLWDEQRKALACKGQNGRRWHPKVIRMCLSVWMRSQKAYEELRKSGMMVLPSGRLLSMYVNSVDHHPGLNDHFLSWMVEEAERLKLSPEGRIGGLIMDEMAIQEDLQLRYTDGGAEIVGLVSLGEESTNMQTLMTGKDSATTATHVLQMVFLGNTGFRFPFAHWPTHEIDPATLYIHFWDAVKWLHKGGFHVSFSCTDGGQANRSFVLMHFKGKDPFLDNFTTTNIFTHEPMVFYMDPWHNFKKIRNGLEKSSEAPKATRMLQNGEGRILWKYWKLAYQFDQESHTLPLHHRLKPEHFDLTPASRMRNHLAEDVLNKDMLYLMKEFQKQRHSQGASDRERLDISAAVQLLENTSRLITNFTDMRPYFHLEDQRLEENDRVLEFFKTWEGRVTGLRSLPSTQRNKMLLSEKARFDISSMVLGFKKVCEISFSKYPGSGIVAARANSNLVENVFCQQRGKNGQNSNPHYLQYGSGINAICFGQTTTTRKSNSGKVDAMPFFKPSSLRVKRKRNDRDE